MIKYSLLDMT